MEEFGITIIEDVGRDPNSVRTLSKRIGFLKLTHYGVDFVVKSKVAANNAAYTSKTLGLHVDLPYYENQPGVIMQQELTTMATLRRPKKGLLYKCVISRWTPLSTESVLRQQVVISVT